MRTKKNRWLLFLAIAPAAMLAFAPPVSAALVFYYDPLTGNVSFDTSQTRSGEVSLYFLDIYDGINDHSPIRFRNENFIRTFSSTFESNKPDQVGDASFSDSISGLITIGDVLPAGISSDAWSTMFQDFHVRSNSPGVIGQHGYTDILGGGRPDPAEFVYGRPDGEFDNRWDLVDPDTLDWAEQASLVYRQATGEVLIDTRGPESGHITAFILHSDGQFLGDQFVPFLDVPISQGDENTIGLFADAIEPGLYSLGNILEAGFTAAEFEAVFTDTWYLGRAGFGGGSFDFEADGIAFNLVFQAVPEPSTLVLAAFAIGLMVIRASRRSGT